MPPVYQGKGPSLHLSWDELACRDDFKTPYPDRWRLTRAKALAAMFEAVRAATGGKPLTVLSAYRTEAHNRAVGGALGSQHVQGRALDLRPPGGMSVAAFHDRIRDLADHHLEIRGIGLYLTFVHVDIRPGGRLTRWSSTLPKESRVA